MPILNTGKEYRQVLILESRRWWTGWQSRFDPARDLVLTYDLALMRDVRDLGGEAHFLDHLCDQQVMQENNFLIYRFFRDWCLDAHGKDIFVYRGIPFGFSFRLEIWNDFVFYVRTRLCMERLREIKFENLSAGTKLGIVESVLREMRLDFTPSLPDEKSKSPAYYFPIFAWMDEKVRHRGVRGFKYRLVALALAIQGTLMDWLDRVSGAGARKATIFAQEYYPTRRLLEHLKKDPRLRVVLASFSRARGRSRYIPVWGMLGNFRGVALELMQAFGAKRCARLVLSNGVDVTESVNRIIEERVGARMTETVRTLDCIIRYMDANPIRLEVLIANIGVTATLVDCVCRKRGIPSYMIINGWMSGEFLDEAKYATVINAYSTSIRDHYFRGMGNIVCLGDPRMDEYVNCRLQRPIDRVSPTVTIGASGHSNVDLNSFLAVEFEFLQDVLLALREVEEGGVNLRIVIKVRANGYREQYLDFVNEYFPGLVDEILDTVPMAKVLARTDFYITFYSSTVFEASCLGIPCVYYKNDSEILDPPYDRKSELVTVDNVPDLVTAVRDFGAGHERYDAFLRKEVMEKYIGPLDGGNLERNLHFFYDMLKQYEKRSVV